MKITLNHGFYAPFDRNRRDTTNNIENILRRAGWRVDTNAARFECDISKLISVLEFLKKNGITGGIILDGI